MKAHKPFLLIIAFVIVSVSLGCSNVRVRSSSTESAMATAYMSATRTLEVFLRTPTSTPFIPPTSTPTKVKTPTPTSTPSPVMIYLPPGSVTAPILLYHHVDENGKKSRYSIEPAVFEQQMQWLYEHGYHTITITKLIDVVKNGGEVPERPFIITFDDGAASVYKNAFPIMQKYHFIGVFYLITGSLGSSGSVDEPEVREMLEAGWEIGSHSRTHANLTLNHALINSEMFGSRSDLEAIFNVPVNTFAYPYGRVDEVVINRAYKYGYMGAMGLGTSFTHTPATLFYLSREEVRFEYDINRFISLLPWQQ